MASDSLIIAGQIELLGGPGGVANMNPLCVNAAGAGTIFRLQPGYDLGEAQPTNDFVGSLALDGERPFGRRASDRTISLPLQIVAPDFTTQAGALELLSQAIDQQTWTLTWTRDPSQALAGGLGAGLPLVLDCFRAQASAVTYGGVDQTLGLPIGAITVTFQALPYGRSDQPVIIPVASPVPGQSAPPAPVVLDSFSSVSGTDFTSSTRHIVGPHSAMWTHGGSTFAPHYVASGLSANLTGLTTLSVWVGVGAAFPSTFVNPCTITFTLTDNASHTISFSVTKTLTPSASASVPNWKLVTAQIPQGRTFTYSNVTAYGVTVSSVPPAPSGIFGFGFNTWFDHVAANPPSVQVAGTRGAVYNLLGVAGTARAAVAVQAQQPGATATDVLSVPGPGMYLVPSTLTGSTVDVTTISGGGAGASVTGAGQGGGGTGGGLAREASLTVTPGELLPYVVGAGGTPQTGISTLAVTTTSLPNGTASAAYSFTFTATGGTAPYTWGRSGTALPSALSLSSGGVLSGTLGAGTGTTSGMIFTVTDSLSATASVTLSMLIKTAAALAITTTSLPGGATGAAYSQTLATNGVGTPPLTWTISAGSLPAGLSLAASTGVISGVPTTVATSSFTVQVNDSASHSDTQVLSIVVTHTSTSTLPLIGFNNGTAFGAPAWQVIFNACQTPGQSFGFRGYGGAGAFPTAWNSRITIPGSATWAMLDWKPPIASILNGSNDAAITQWGVSCQKQWNKNPGSLMVGLWHEAETSQTSANILAVHAYVFPRFVAACNSVGTPAGRVPYGQVFVASRVAGTPSQLVSCPATISGGSKLDFYGVDGYTDVSNSDGSASGFRSPSAVFTAAFNAILGLVPTATFTIPECNCETYAQRGQWFRDLLTFCTTGTFAGRVSAIMPFFSGSNSGDVISWNTDDSPAPGTIAGITALVAGGAPSASVAIGSDPPAVDGQASSFQGDSVLVTEAGGKSATSITGATFTSTSSNTVHEPGGAGASGASSGGAGPGTPYTCAGFAALGASPSVPVTHAVAAGDAVVLLISVNTGTVASVTDSQGNSYTAIDSEFAGATLKLYAYLCNGAGSALTTSDHFLVTTAGSTPGCNVIGRGCSGVVTTSPVDISGIGTTGTSTAPSVGPTGALAQASEWVFGAIVSGNGGGAAGTWTGGVTLISNQHTGSLEWLSAADQVVSATTTKTLGATIVSAQWGMIAFSLKFSSGGGAAFGGGGGSAPNNTTAGGAAVLSAGGVPPAGAAAGGAGSLVADGLPSQGGSPGGGSGGAASSGAAMLGAAGQNGQILITRTTSQQSFSSLILHTPSLDAPQGLSPLVSFGATPVIADGSIEYPVPALTAGVNATFGGTYSIVAVAQNLNSPGASRVLQVTVNQYEFTGGPVYHTSAQRTFAPTGDGITNGIIEVGALTLPVKDIAPDNTASFFTVTITDTNLADTYLDVLFLDTTGQTVIISEPNPGAYLAYYIDPPAAANDLGRVLATSTDRTAAISVMDAATLSGGPLAVYPAGDNMLVAYAREGAPQLQLSYWPAWFIERLS